MRVQLPVVPQGSQVSALHEAVDGRLVAGGSEPFAHKRCGQFIILGVNKQYPFDVLQTRNGLNVVMVFVGTRKYLHKDHDQDMQFFISFFIIGEVRIQAVFDDDGLKQIIRPGGVGDRMGRSKGYSVSQ